jgi:rhodanese-related sulfurtransferase
MIEKLAMDCSQAAILTKNKEKAIFVDIRDQADYNKYRISGSLNIPLYEVKYKSFLKGKAVIIVNDGYGYILLADECSKLLQAGFDIKVLNGGIRKWADLGYQVEGIKPSVKDLASIKAESYFSSHNGQEWLAVDASNAQNKSSKTLPDVQKIPFSKSGIEFCQTLKRHIDTHSESYPFCTILIFSRSGEGYSQIQEAIEKKLESKSLKCNVYYLDGGLEGYKNVLDKQVSLQNPGNGNLASSKLVNGRKIAKPCSKCP